MRRICCALLFPAAVTIGAADECSCVALEKEVRTLRAEMEEMKIEMRKLMGADARERAPERIAVEPVPELHGRRLSGASTFVSVPARQVHEFVNGHSCPNVGGYMQALPVKTSGGVSWSPSPSDVTSEISLGAVSTGWSMLETSTLPSPLRLVHDEACALPPTLELRLNTSVHGSLTLNGHELAAGPRDTESYAASADSSNAVLSITQQDPTTFLAVGGMTKTVYLDASRTVLAWYSFGWLSTPGTSSTNNNDWAMMEAKLMLDGVAAAATGSRTGAVHNREVAGTNVGLWMGTLTAGSHTFAVQVKPSNARTFDSRSDSIVGEERALHVLVL